jgi:hypothetical protein
MQHPKTVRSNMSPRWGHPFKPYIVIVDEELFLVRRRLQCPWFGILLTQLIRPDTRDPHRHSRWFASWILRGGYTETLSSGVTRTHTRWSWHVMPRHLAHTITAITHPCTTLVLVGRYHGDWQFVTSRGLVDKDAYG